MRYTVSGADVIISSNFDRGSIDTLTEIAPNYFKGKTKHWIKADGIGDQFYWFNFRMDNVKNKKVTIELTDLVGVYRGNPATLYLDDTYPVFTYDQINWGRITDVTYDSNAHIFTFSKIYEQDSVWVAYAHPYSVTRKNEFLSRIKDNQYVTVDSIGASRQNRSIDLITITDPSIAKAGKKVVFIDGIQHAG
ncbi:MAG: hypothetical protein IH949_09460, partial [Bacteroidetes bacterium]|nr:hypothetical protein [Bacteroidota bacterium]